LILFVDSPNTFVENNESNNQVTAAQRFATGADLQPISIAPHDATGGLPGQSIMFDITIQQNGIPRSGSIALGIVASPDRIWDVNDPPIGRAMVTLSGALSETFRPTLTLPNLPPGSYYPIVVVDETNQIPEYDEFNNIAVSQT